MPMALQQVRPLSTWRVSRRPAEAADVEPAVGEMDPSPLRGHLPGLVASVLLHLALLATWAVCRLPVDEPASDPAFSAVLGLHDDDVPQPAILTVPDPHDDSAADAAPSPETPLQIAHGEQLVHPELALVDVGPPITSERLGAPDESLKLTLATGGQGRAVFGKGMGQGQGEFQGEPANVRFFGAEAEGVSFAFVVDCSTSMAGLNSQGRQSRFAYAVAELETALAQLGPQQLFYVVFYNHQTFPMGFPRPVRGMLPASDDNRAQAWQWVQQFGPSGGTFPLDAMRLALGLQPDVVFFLTDGEIPPMTRPAARMASSGKSVVHTIAFGSLFGEHTLRGIAADHEGTFRFVP